MVPETIASASPDSIHAHAAGASVIQVETSRLLPWLMLTCILSGASVAVGLFSMYQLAHTEREYRLLQLQVQDQSAIMIREGLKQPGDFANGPGGNLEYKRRK